MMLDIPAVVALGLSLGLGIIHFFTEQIDIKEGRTRWRIISLAAGISIGYLFLHLLPETYQEAEFLKHWVFVFLLAGFALVHLAEKFAHKHAQRRELVTELKIIHLVIFFIYYFMVGMMIEDKARIGIFEGVLFVIPIALHSAFSTSSLTEMHGKVRESLAVKILMSAAPILGSVLAIGVPIPPVVDSILTSFIAGVLIFVFVKEFLPQGRKGEPAFFVIGLAVYTVFSLLLLLL
jgi:zinc transporter ZupT